MGIAASTYVYNRPGSDMITPFLTRRCGETMGRQSDMLTSAGKQMTSKRPSFRQLHCLDEFFPYRSALASQQPSAIMVCHHLQIEPALLSSQSQGEGMSSALFSGAVL